MAPRVEYLERLIIRMGAHHIATLIRPKAAPGQVVIHSCASEFEPDLRTILKDGLQGVGLVIEQADSKFLEHVASYFSRAFGFTTVLEHADP